jgi:hypothetical protein
MQNNFVYQKKNCAIFYHFKDILNKKKHKTFLETATALKKINCLLKDKRKNIENGCL